MFNTNLTFEHLMQGNKKPRYFHKQRGKMKNDKKSNKQQLPN